jgi:nucleoside-diphosphate-sugar epimerase
MRILVLGGTSFVGRAIVEQALREELLEPTYGPLKVACEDDVLARYGQRATIVRPGKVAGPTRQPRRHPRAPHHHLAVCLRVAARRR